MWKKSYNGLDNRKRDIRAHKGPMKTIKISTYTVRESCPEATQPHPSMQPPYRPSKCLWKILLYKTREPKWLHKPRNSQKQKKWQIKTIWTAHTRHPKTLQGYPLDPSNTSTRPQTRSNTSESTPILDDHTLPDLEDMGVRLLACLEPTPHHKEHHIYDLALFKTGEKEMQKC